MPAVSPRHIAESENWSIAAIWVMLGSCLVRETIGRTEIVQVANYTLHVIDISLIFLILAVAINILRVRLTLSLTLMPILVIVGLTLLNLLRGSLLDPGQTLVWIRINVSLSLILLLAISAPTTPRFWRGVVRGIHIAALFLVTLLALRGIFGHTLFILYEFDSAIGLNDGNRSIAAFGAFVLALSFIIALSTMIQPHRRFRVATWVWPGVLLLSLAMSGQGTAAMCAVIGGVVVLIAERSLFRAPMSLLVAIGVALGVVYLIAGTVVNLEDVSLGAWDLSRRTSTYESREEIWARFLDSFAHYNAFDKFFGLPAGRSPAFTVYLSGVSGQWKSSLHSMYIGTLPVLGIVGLSMFVILMLQLLIGLVGRTNRMTRLGGPVRAVPLACVIATLVLSITYEVRYEQVLGLFIGIWWLQVPIQSRRRRLARAGFAVTAK